MEAQLLALTCALALACLLQPASADKTKLIVKVPHLIKHVHIDHMKPVHIHTRHSKKVDHHHIADEDWEFTSHKGLAGHSGFSNIEPITWHLEPSKKHESKVALKGYYKKSVGEITKKTYKQLNVPEIYENDQKTLASKNIHKAVKENRTQKNINKEIRLRSESDALDSKRTRGFSRGFRQSKARTVTSQDEKTGESDWKPAINVKGQRDISTMKNNLQKHRGEQLFNSKDHKLQYNTEALLYGNKDHVNTNNMIYKDLKQNKKNAGDTRGSMPHIQDFISDHRFLSHAGQVQSPQPYLGEDGQFWGEFPHVKQSEPDLSHHKWIKLPNQNLQQPQTQSVTPQSLYRSEMNFKSYPQHPQQIHHHEIKVKHIQPKEHQLSNQQEHYQQIQLHQFLQPPIYQETHLQQQQQQDFHQQGYQHQPQTIQQHQRDGYSETYQPQLQQSAVGHPEHVSNPSKVSLSEHRLQSPEQSLWLVQQQSARPAPVHGHLSSHNPYLLHRSDLSSSTLIESKLPFQDLQQNTRGNSPNSQHRKVKQQWHQSVVMGTSGNGPASSYKFEVINYSPAGKVP